MRNLIFVAAAAALTWLGIAAAVAPAAELARSGEVVRL
jgi:hypothetical protein